MPKTVTRSIIENEYVMSVEGHEIDTTVTHPSGVSKGKILFLHGAGESTKDRCLPLARALSAQGWECLTFSFPGHGKSSGSLEGSTLAGRKEIARQIAGQQGFLPADIMVGVSMGGHTALSLLADDPSACDRLVLLVPAVYAGEAEEVPFGPAFSKVLRTPFSYRSAKVWDGLPQFRGQLVTVQTGQDQVIPPEIYELIHKHAKNATTHRVFIRHSPHRISFWMANDTARTEAFADAINAFKFDSLRQYS